MTAEVWQQLQVEKVSWTPPPAAQSELTALHLSLPMHTYSPSALMHLQVHMIAVY